jgi:hypothetical protein
MNNRRLSDQVEILKAINDVRNEIKIAHKNGVPNFEQYEILGRLISLYSLLDVENLAQVAKNADIRRLFQKKAA